MIDILDSFKGKKVLIVGDVMIDSYLWGDISRISPEAPVPVIALRKEESRLGGAANVALNIQSLGAEPILCSVIGEDDKAKLLADLLDENDISSQHIFNSKDRVTTVKHRIISKNQHVIRVDSEMDSPISSNDTEKLLGLVFENLNNVDVILFQDYDKGVLNSNLIEKIIAEANLRNIPIAVDPKKRNFLSYNHVTLFKPNLKELEEGLKIDINSEELDSIKQASNKLLEVLQVKIALITLSDKGIYINEEGREEIIPTNSRKIIDVSGAGDTVISVAALGLAVNAKISEVAQIANIAAGLVCEKVGVVPVDRELLIERINSL